MAFSFRAGTKWCHDFPKLARESGFYFNVHATRVRVDWNHISSIDIDQVIKERDFKIVDENVNNVIDYYLENKCDVKILNSNFIKLFRLAQLAVEYLLYCKQYLDQSVVILKEELKLKIDENIKLKEENIQLQNMMKQLKEKFKQSYKCAETKSVTYREIHKCPWCPKTFISASFVNAHLVRRHSNLSEALSSSLPIHEEYRNQTEKLYDEIKTLKERLNKAERVIRKESHKIIVQNEILNKNKKMESVGENKSFFENTYAKYEEQTNDLKNVLFAEIRNNKIKENNKNETNHENIKELINQQENEIQRLKIQLQEHLTSTINEIKVKLYNQEEHWKSKIKQLENQHRCDIENLLSQLKLTQESSIQLKSEYENKILFLEKQYISQSKLLLTQSEQFQSTLSKSTHNSQNKKFLQKQPEIRKLNKQRIKSFTEDKFSHNIRKSLKNTMFQNDNQSLSDFKFNQRHSRLLRNNNLNDSLKSNNIKEPAKQCSILKYKQKRTEECSFYTNPVKKYLSPNELEERKSNSDTETKNKFVNKIEDMNETHKVHTENTNCEAYLNVQNNMIQQSSDKKCTKFLEVIKEKLQEAFYSRLKDLGIDPEWSTIPIVTFREKLEIIRYHQNILSKKLPKYKEIHKKLFEEVSKNKYLNKKSVINFERENKFLNEETKNIKLKALNAVPELEVQKNNVNDIQSIKYHSSWTPDLSRNNKSVLKSTGSVRAVVKKKVLFSDPDKKMDTKYFIKDNTEKKCGKIELNENSNDIQSILREKQKNIENIY